MSACRGKYRAWLQHVLACSLPCCQRLAFAQTVLEFRICLCRDPTRFGGISYFHANHASREEPEIWTPDLLPYNHRKLMNENFEHSVALVMHTGEVKYSRPGILDGALCD